MSHQLFEINSKKKKKTEMLQNFKKILKDNFTKDFKFGHLQLSN